MDGLANIRATNVKFLVRSCENLENVFRNQTPLFRNDSTSEKHEVLVTDLPSYITFETMRLILDRQGFKARNIKINTLRVDGTTKFHGIMEFGDERTAREWIKYNEVRKNISLDLIESLSEKSCSHPLKIECESIF